MVAAALAKRAFPLATPSSPRNRDARPIDMDGLPEEELTDAAWDWMFILGVLGVWDCSIDTGCAWSVAEDEAVELFSEGLGVEAWRGASEPEKERFMEGMWELF